MTITEEPAAGTGPDTAQTIERLQGQGVRFIRMLYSDLHGIARGKVIPLQEFEEICTHGSPFVGAIMTVDLRHNVVAGFESGFEDIVAKPDLSTAVVLPWEPHVAWCLCDLETLGAHETQPYPVDPRGALKRAVAAYAELGLTPIMGPELEFYLLQRDDSARGGYRRYQDKDSPVYTTGAFADPIGVLERLLENCVVLGLGAFAANQEYGRGQFEINLGHSEALDSADRAFLFKSTVKELAARDGLLATFMGKPWNDDEGSGFHLHVSLAGDSNANALDDEAGDNGLSDLARHFIAGVLDHAPALMGFLNPTVNAYRRIHPEALVPTRVNWGHDNRFTYIRIPRERGKATRIEVRIGDGAANPYLAYAAVLFAGLDGIKRRLDPPAPLAGLIYELPEEEIGAELPSNLTDALTAMNADEVLKEGLGAPLVETFLTIKNYELDRYRKWVSDWEFDEYAYRL